MTARVPGPAPSKDESLNPEDKRMEWKFLLIALRPKQWIKNLFLFIPLIFGKRLFEPSYFWRTVVAAALFSMASSAVYLFNDFMDLESDRAHRTKKLRPLASGRLGKRKAIATAVLLLAGSLAGSLALDPALFGVIAIYVLLNLLYSKWLKKIVIIDVFCIGIFFMLRIIAGTFISRVEFSHWMIFMIVLLAMFLAFNKRRQELRCSARQNAAEHRWVLSKYSLYFIDQMISALTSSIVVVYMLYTVDDRTVNLFGSKHLIITIPFVYYGVFRYLYLVHRRQEGEDPTNLLLQDRMMRINLILWILTCVAVVYFGF